MRPIKIMLALLISLSGCQQSSEIDKCVEAILVQGCREENGEAEKSCKATRLKAAGADMRLMCLRAAAGK